MIKKMNKFIALAVVLAFSSAALNACAPRGESQNLSDILTQSRDRYRISEKSISDTERKGQLTQLAERLNQIEKVQDPEALKPATAEIKAALSQLLKHAGYTVRPSLSELISQYQAIANGSAVTTDPSLPGSPEVRLLLVRTYSVLATELETGKFSL